MEAIHVTQNVSTYQLAEVLARFAADLDKARNGKQSIEAAPLLFKTGERNVALFAVQALRESTPQLIELLTEIRPQLDALQAELEELEGGPEITPTGLSYDTAIPKDALSTRALNCLTSGNVLTLRQLCALEVQDMMRMRNLGRKTFDELVAYRAKLGVPFNLN